MKTFFYITNGIIRYVKGVSFKDALNKVKYTNNQKYIKLYPDFKVAVFRHSIREDFLSEIKSKDFIIIYTSGKQLYFRKNKHPRFNIDSEMEFISTIESGISFGKWVVENKISDPEYYLEQFYVGKHYVEI